MVAWEAYKQTDDFKTTKVWAQHPAHVDGSLWAVIAHTTRKAKR